MCTIIHYSNFSAHRFPYTTWDEITLAQTHHFHLSQNQTHFFWIFPGFQSVLFHLQQLNWDFEAWKRKRQHCTGTQRSASGTDTNTSTLLESISPALSKLTNCTTSRALFPGVTQHSKTNILGQHSIPCGYSHLQYPHSITTLTKSRLTLILLWNLTDCLLLAVQLQLSAVYWKFYLKVDSLQQWT